MPVVDSNCSNDRALLWNECDRYVHGGHEFVMLWSYVCDEVFVVVCDWGAALFRVWSHSGAVLAIKRDWLLSAWLHSPVINREVDACK